MHAPLIDHRTPDGSRQFAELPQTQDWFTVRDHVSALPRAELTKFVCDGVTEAWIHFTLAGHQFSINDQFGDYWFFVDPPDCADKILQQVADHFAELLVPP